MLSQSHIHCLIALFAVYIGKSYPTPVYNHLEAHSPYCPSSWFQYDRFCVTPAREGSERAVALYCDGLGGIGVSGICVIKARTVAPTLEEPGLMRSSKLSPMLQSADRAPEVDIGVDREPLAEVEYGSCPSGWAHYRSMCVYKPWSSEERCHQMGAVQFHGMCLKHAEPKEATEIDNIRSLAQEKRICCCAHPGGSSNGYGC
ncbi:hypothetical protein ElyMa_003829200 [Elysia marginata]|uniref:Uncharacterized protein n=1 Tax=Elysia marginata TaxID=1093978 RepID=A0AAV4FI16_9GAST|nr:hypothetical protein ElyMa_003829200 [Elysia marginata]